MRRDFRVIDCFPFFNELDVLEIRLHELDPVVDAFLILECEETFGGSHKPLYLRENLRRFHQFREKIIPVFLPKLFPSLRGLRGRELRDAGRLRERNQRNAMMPHLLEMAQDQDIVIFSDCDEIPSSSAVRAALDQVRGLGIHRFKQRSYYYNVNCLIDYGRDICSRARIGTFAQVKACGSLYDFRMYRKNDLECPALEAGGWHFSYFGGDPGMIEHKVAALSPFLEEYKLYGREQLIADVMDLRDLHHRSPKFSELPARFTFVPSDDPALPAYFRENVDRFRHFTLEDFRNRYINGPFPS